MVATAVWINDDGETTLLGVAAGVPGWQKDALCVEHPETEWFVEHGGNWRAAKAICARCLVRQDCLAFALDEEIGEGIWGGATAVERKQLQKRGVTGDLVRKYGPNAVSLSSTCSRSPRCRMTGSMSGRSPTCSPTSTTTTNARRGPASVVAATGPRRFFGP
jgi:Transcription factor WhiB